jgi:hypothetical protein
MLTRVPGFNYTTPNPPTLVDNPDIIADTCENIKTCTESPILALIPFASSSTLKLKMALLPLITHESPSRGITFPNISLKLSTCNLQFSTREYRALLVSADINPESMAV